MLQWKEPLQTQKPVALGRLLRFHHQTCLNHLNFFFTKTEGHLGIFKKRLFWLHWMKYLLVKCSQVWLLPIPIAMFSPTGHLLEHRGYFTHSKES